MKNLYLIREVSTLQFNERVLQEAEDERNPLLERLKFLGIFSSNMDEFFKVRVAGIHRRIEIGKTNLFDVLDLISEKTRELDERFRNTYANIIQALASEGIKVLTERDIAGPGDPLAIWLDEYFHARVLPHLVPIILHKTLPFPPLTDGALYFGVQMWGDAPRHAVLEIPANVPRFVELPNGNIMYVDDVIRHALNEIFYIFPYDRIDAFEFKISRDAELDIDNDFTDGHLRKIQRALKQRKGGRPTRFVYDAAMPAALLQLLLKRLEIDAEDTIIAGGRYHNMKDLMRFPAKRPGLTFEPMDLVPHPMFDHNRTPMFDVLRKHDLLVTYPYQSFDHLTRLLREAAIDPAVEEIRMTLYRVAKNSQVINALANAARNGKRIFVSIELQARFDEENNIAISERLTEAGARVTYGVPPMKVHGKLVLIRRNDTAYAALSTGNFNEDTGRLYVDSTLMTADKRITAEVSRVFDYLEQASTMHTVSMPRFKHLLVSPFNSRREFLRLLDREIAKGKDGYVFIKVNHLTDIKIIRKIEHAAEAGVRLELVVRTTYSVPPHKNIYAISILDRYLEHQRVYIFGRGDDQKVFMSSCDLMERNLDRRVEVAFPIYAPELRRQAADMMALQIADTSKARILDENQSNPYVGRDGNQARVQYTTHDFLSHHANKK